MAIVPDDKDWTWVLARPCSQCGYDPASVDIAGLPSLLLDNAGRWAAVLQRPDPAVRRDEATWSPLEYAAHVRDVHQIMRKRLNLILTQDEAVLPNWDQDATAVQDRYREQDPASVAQELLEAAQDSAAAFALVRDRDLARSGTRSDGVRFTVETLGIYYAHECVHHICDASRE